MTVSELAKAANVNPQTIRYYERIGLLAAPKRRASGYRDYKPEALKRLRFILEAKQIGFTLSELSDLLGLDSAKPASCQLVRDMVETRLVELDEKVKAIRQVQKSLRRIAGFCAENGPNVPCPVLEVLDSGSS